MAAAGGATLPVTPEGCEDLRNAVVTLLSLSALPDTWARLDREDIVRATADALQAMSGVSGIHIHLPSGIDGPALDIRCGDSPDSSDPLTLSFRRSAPIGIGGGFIAIKLLERSLSNPVDRLLLNTAAAQIRTTLARRRGEKAEKRLALLVERSNDFIGVASPDGKPHYVNASGLALVGLTSLDQLSPLHILDFIAPAERGRIEAEAIPAMKNQGHWFSETTLRRFDTGELIPVLLDCFRIDDSFNGEPVDLAAVMRDLRPQKEIERALRDFAADASEKARQRGLERDDAKARLEEVRLELFHASRLSVAGQMAGMLTHELSQPLTAALNAASAARRLCLSEGHKLEELRELIEDHLAQTERAGTILRRWRHFVRPESIARHQPEDLPRLVEEAIGFAFVGPAAVGVLLSVYFDPAAPAVRVDRIQIEQLIANLVRNALDALRGVVTPVLRLSTARRDADTVEILVADSGSGVDEEMRDRLFEPFQSSKRNGMGLGLSICRTIVEAHGGTIDYEPRVGGGSLFRLTLPASDTSIAI